MLNLAKRSFLGCLWETLKVDGDFLVFLVACFVVFMSEMNVMIHSHPNYRDWTMEICF